MTTIAFWILVSVSNGSYNSGTMDEFSVRFPTEASCQLTAADFPVVKDFHGNRQYIVDCVKVEY